MISFRRGYFINCVPALDHSRTNYQWFKIAQVHCLSAPSPAHPLVFLCSQTVPLANRGGYEQKLKFVRHGHPSPALLRTRWVKGWEWMGSLVPLAKEAWMLPLRCREPQITGLQESIVYMIILFPIVSFSFNLSPRSSWKSTNLVLFE